MKKILLLTDFSEASHHALQFARSFFSDTLADFHLLCAHPAENDTFCGTSHVTRTARTTFSDQLQAVVTGLRQQSINEWHSFRASAMPGKLIDAVQTAMCAESYDLVIMGAKKHGLNDLFGKHAATLVHQLEANVMVVPLNVPIRPVHRVVLATDFSSLTNYKLLWPLKEFVVLKGAILTLLTVDTPDKKRIYVEQEQRIRQFLNPVEPAIARLRAPTAKAGVDAYLSGHMVDLLVTIPRRKDWTGALAADSPTGTLVYSSTVPVLTLYDNSRSSQPLLMKGISNFPLTTYIHV